MTGTRAVYAAATDYFTALVRQVPDGRWDDPGLGEWTVRDLVGHTSRSLTTVSAYLKAPAQREDVADAADYYVRIQELSASLGADAIVERGRQAGRDLGDDPVAAIEALASRVQTELAAVDDTLIEVIGGLGIRLSSYLPTRTFELAVHGLDIARAVGVDLEPPTAVLTEATALAARIGVALRQGPTMLRALTGRGGLPPGFSVV